MRSFDFLTAGRIRFGPGSRSGAAEAVRNFGTRILLVRGRSVAWANTFRDELRDKDAEVAEVFCTSEPDLALLEAARAQALDFKAEVVVSIGGGSVVDLGKAVAALAPSRNPVLDHLEVVGLGKPLTTKPLPFVALPTTSGTGSEVTKNAVISVPDAGRKVSLRDDRMLANLAIVDPELTYGAPRLITLFSGLDAVSQVIEPYLCNKSNILVDAMARSAIPTGLNALAVLAQREETTARDELSFVSLCGGLALANAGLGAVHGLAGVIGGRTGASHGLLCGRLLGPILAENSNALKSTGPYGVRFCEVKHWMIEALNQHKSFAFEDLTAVLDNWGLPRLGQWLNSSVDLGRIADESQQSSSMRANPCVLPSDALVRAIQHAL